MIKLEEIIKKSVLDALAENKGCIEKTAVQLDISRGTLYRWFDNWNINVFSYRMGKTPHDEGKTGKDAGRTSFST